MYSLFFRVLKLSSCHLNYLIVAGATLLYLSVFFYVFSERNNEDIVHDILCNVRLNGSSNSFLGDVVNVHMFLLSPTQLQQWLFSFGYTLCFAVILAKTWRVYYIFTNPRPKKKVQCTLKHMRTVPQASS
jgi:gamma-aminobutyric acid type B receptor